MRSIGIDIGSISIKIAEVTSTSQGFVLNDFLELPLSPDPGIDKRIEIIDHLRKISAHYGNTGVRYVFAVPQEKTAVRHLDFPFKERHNILKSLSAQLEDDIPFSSDDAVFEAKTLRTRGNSAEVLSYTSPNSYIKETLHLAYDAGIDPDIVTVDVPAAANLFETWTLPPRDIPHPKAAATANEVAATVAEETRTDYSIEAVPPCQVTIYLGHTRSYLLVFYRNTLLTTRTLSRGGHDIVESLRRTYQLPYAEALKGLQDKGFVLTSTENATQDQIDFSNIISTALKSLTDEIKLTLLEIRSQYEVEFNQVYLTGGVSRLMNIGPFFTQELELPCNQLSLTERVPRNGMEMSPAAEYAGLTAIGIAIEGLKKPRNPAINLRRGEFGKQSKSFNNFVTRWGYTLKYAGIALAIFYAYSISRGMIAEGLETAGRIKFQDTAKETFGLKGRAASESKVKSFIKDKRREIDAKKDLVELQNINSILDIVSLLSEKIPSKNQVNVDIRRLLIKNENVTIEGEVSQQSQVNLIRTALTSIASDQNVRDMSPSIQPSQGKLVFAFNLKVNRK